MTNPPPSTRYFPTPDPNVVIACDYNPDDQQYSNYRPMRLEDISEHALQPTASAGLSAALHSYVHVPQRPNVKPYFKLSTARPPAAGQADRAATDGGPWNVPDLCAGV